MQISDAAVTGRRRKAVVERYSPRHEGRAPPVREDPNSMLVDVVSLDEIIHDLSDDRFHQYRSSTQCCL
jgi:hypothetical protein